MFHYNYCVSCRIEELFDILVEFPDSEPALLDLKECLEKVNLRSFLISSLQVMYAVLSIMVITIITFEAAVHVGLTSGCCIQELTHPTL